MNTIPVASLTPNDRNPRTITPVALAKLAKSIERDPTFMSLRPIIVDGDGVILGGNQRFAACKVLGMTELPSSWVRTAEGLTDAQRKRFVLIDNAPEGMAGEWDLDALLADWQIPELGDLGFDMADLAASLPTGEEVDAEPQTDRAEELRQEWGVEAGQLWALGDHRMLCGDSTKAEDVARLMAGAKADLCFTSPPYASQRKYDESSGFKPIPPDEYVDWWAMIQEQASNALGADGSFIVNIKEHAEGGERHPYVKRMTLKMIDDWGWKWVDEYAWIRQGIPGSAEMMGRFRNAWESVFWFAVGSPIFNPRSVMHESDNAFKYSDQVAAGKTINTRNQGKGNASNSPVGHGGGMAYPSNVLDIKHKAETVGHSAAFPVQLPAFFIKANASEGSVVYEPFLGSGTTLIAAEQLGRKCYGMEISPAYCAVVLQRFKDATGKVPTLVAP